MVPGVAMLPLRKKERMQMKSPFGKILLGLGVVGGTLGLGLGIGSIVSGAATSPSGSSNTATITAPTSATTTSTTMPCPHMNGASTR